MTLNVLHPFTSRVVWSHWLLMTSLALTLLLIGNLKSYSRPPPGVVQHVGSQYLGWTLFYILVLHAPACHYTEAQQVACCVTY